MRSSVPGLPSPLPAGIHNKWQNHAPGKSYDLQGRFYMNNAELNELKQRYVANGVASPSTEFAARAENAELWDADGRRFIDFAGGIGVLNLGHRHPQIVAAIKAQLDQLMHTCQTVMGYEPYVRLAQKLCELAPVEGSAKAMLVNTGAEALENA